jgi:hypothetical protein
MGRAKIEIKLITNEKKRKVTFNKRKKGAFKKAMELGILTGQSTLMISRNIDGSISSVNSGGNDDIDNQRLIHDYLIIAQALQANLATHS